MLLQRPPAIVPRANHRRAVTAFGCNNVRRGRCCSAVAQEVAAYSEVWSAFANKAQGEWEGVTVTFDASGQPQQLPDRYVPGAFREWGVQLFDWQSQCSSSCSPPSTGAAASAATASTTGSSSNSSSRALYNCAKRLMPTVGCEADAIAFVEETENVWRNDGGMDVKPVLPNGSYVAAPAAMPDNDNRMRVEACLATQDGTSRLRVVATLMEHFESKQWGLFYLDVNREQYEGPYRGGVELSGCAGGGAPFAKDAPTPAEHLGGSWHTLEAAGYVSNGKGLELQAGPAPDRLSSAGSGGPDPVLLPLGLWAVCRTEGQGDISLEIGALRDVGMRDVVTCTYQGSRLQQVWLGREAKA